MFGLNKILKQNKTQLENDIKNLQAKASLLDSDIGSKTREIAELESRISRLTVQAANYQSVVSLGEGYIEMEDIGFEYETPNMAPDEAQRKIQDVQQQIAMLLGNQQVIQTTREYRVNGSEAKGREFQKAYCENLLIGFNSYFEKKKRAVTSNNFDKTIKL